MDWNIDWNGGMDYWMELFGVQQMALFSMYSS